VHPIIGEFVIDESFTLEVLELLHPHEIRRNLPNGGWRRVSLRVLIALLQSGAVRGRGGDLNCERIELAVAGTPGEFLCIRRRHPMVSGCLLPGGTKRLTSIGRS
jgi:hypothetical protein